MLCDSSCTHGGTLLVRLHWSQNLAVATDQCKQAMPEYVRSGNVNVACYEVANLIEQEKRMQEAES